MQQLLRNVLHQITPTESEIKAEQRIARELMEKIRSITGKHIGVQLVGSLARNTHLKGDRDIDLFVLFPISVTRETFEKEGLRIGKEVLKNHFWEEAYSEHPYIRGIYKEFEVEIVPSYKVEHPSQKLSSVDRSPFHNAYLLKKQRMTQKNQVRLLRQFLKGIGSYGADTHHHALPGFGVELLILKYKTFANALRRIGKWKKPVLIDIEKYWKPIDALRKFEEYPLVLIDPTDSQRNVAAALSKEQFEKMQMAAKAFLKKPREEFFFPKTPAAIAIPMLKKQLRKRGLVAIWMKYPVHALSDIVWGQLDRMGRLVQQQFEQAGFSVKKTESYTDEQSAAGILIELNEKKLSPGVLRTGPLVEDTANLKRFLAAHKGAKYRVQHGRTVISVKRSVTAPKEVLTELKTQLRESLRPPLSQSLSGARLTADAVVMVQLAGQSKAFRDFVTAFLKPTKFKK